MDNLNLEKVVSFDPKVDVEETFRPKEVIYKSGINKSRYAVNADSYSDSSIQWNSIVPPSFQTVVERALRVQYVVQITSTYTSAGATVANSPYFPAIDTRDGGGTLYSPTFSGCLRDWPLQQCCSGIDLKINGMNTSTSPSDWISVFSHIVDENELNRYCAEFPCQKDNNAVYSLPNPLAVVDAPTLNNLRSPFIPYSQNTNLPSRASFLGKLISSTNAGGKTTDVYQFTITEQLIVSPCTWGNGIDNGMGLSNISSIQLNIKLDNLNRAVSVCPGALAGANTIAITMSAVKPVLLVEYITPDPVMSARQPAELVYGYETIQTDFTTNQIVGWNNATALNSYTGVANSIRLGAIPDKIFIYIRPSKSSLAGNAKLAQSMPSIFLRITNLSLNFNNRISLFNTYTEADLYKMSVANGLKDDFHAWKYGGCCVIIIDVAKDIQLEPQQVAGQANSYMTLTPTLTFDPSPLVYSGQAQACNYDIYTVCTQTGKAVISKNACQFMLTAPNGEEVLQATTDPNAKVDNSELVVLGKAQGGSIFSKGMKLLHRGLAVAKTVAKHVKPEHLEMASNALDSLGLGGQVAGGKLHKKAHKRVY